MYYDPEANLISWEISSGAIARAHRVGNFIIHFSPAGQPVLIEMLDASKFVGQFDKIKKTEEIKKMIPAN